MKITEIKVAVIKNVSGTLSLVTNLSERVAEGRNVIAVAKDAEGLLGAISTSNAEVMQFGWRERGIPKKPIKVEKVTAQITRRFWRMLEETLETRNQHYGEEVYQAAW